MKGELEATYVTQMSTEDDFVKYLLSDCMCGMHQCIY